MALELYNDGNHVCLMFSDLAQDEGEAIQANQFLVVDNRHGSTSNGSLRSTACRSRARRYAGSSSTG